LALATAAVAMVLITFNATATNIALPEIEDHFTGASLTTISWIVSAFNVVQTTLMLVGGRLADRIGRRRVFLAGMLVFAVGSALSGVAPTVGLLIAARVVQAIGAALILPASLTAVLPEFPASRHATVVSLWASMGVLGASAAPTLTAGLLELGGWRIVFLASAPVALLAWLAGRRVMRESLPARAPGPLDVVGAVMGTAALGLAAIAIVQGPRWGWNDPVVIFAWVGALILFPMFVWRSRTHPEPLVHLDLFRVRAFSVSACATSLLAAGAGATWLLYPLFLHEVWGYSILAIGLAITPGPIVVVLCNPLAGQLADRIGYRPVLVLGSWLPVAGTAWMAINLTPEPRYLFAFLPGTTLIGIGMGMVLGVSNSAALRDLPHDDLSAANATFNTMRSLGMAIGVAVAVAIIGDLERVDLVAAFDRAWLVFTLIMAAAPVVLAIWYPRDRRRWVRATPPAGVDVATTAVSDR
jgi:EmrB/QacA subfamily drug resistance transporter